MLHLSPIGLKLAALALSLCLSGVANAAQPQAAWQLEWDKTLRAAEAEGALVIYMTQAFEPVFRGAFQKNFPRSRSRRQRDGGRS